MPYVTNLGVKIYWEEHGSGEPVLMIMGLSFTLDMWHRTLPLIARTRRALVFDNRGVGRSDVPGGPYSIPGMAEDAKAVLDAAGVDGAHVIGASMGGMIAQELALRHPSRVKSLILACTSCGGLRAKFPQPSRFRNQASWPAQTPQDRILAFNPLLYHPGTPPERIEEDNRIRLRWHPTPRGYLNQLIAILRWSSYGRLPRISVPTLIVHGDSDVIVPPENAAILARRIPNAQVRMIPAAGHIFTTDQPELSHRWLLDFFQGRKETSTNGLSGDSQGATSI
ncbi:MAG TPA: alpha/beta fold hydrolase [Bryobacteraceae bacterium]|jgi:pimeloyl-ACP methyl ester carboxylesterase|nr:alpha/beta fold hydrolase [Bryobacteraceae bacterium]